MSTKSVSQSDQAAPNAIVRAFDPRYGSTSFKLAKIGIAALLVYQVAEMYFSSKEPTQEWCVETTGALADSLLIRTIKAACSGEVPKHFGCPHVAKATFANIAKCPGAAWLLRQVFPA